MSNLFGNGNFVGESGPYCLPEGETALSMIGDAIEVFYDYQIDQMERPILEANTGDPDAAAQEVNQYRDKFRQFRRTINSDEMKDRGVVIVWGAAEDLAKQPLVTDMWNDSADALVCENEIPPNFGHGSSETGNMGVGDHGIVLANEHRKTLPIYEEFPVESAIMTVPLNWPIDAAMEAMQKERAGRETGVKSNLPEQRCPQFLLIELRTMIFSMIAANAKLMSFFALLPGGYGTRFEAFWRLLSGQLRAKLLTCLSDRNGNLPPMLLFDYYHTVDRQMQQIDELIKSLRQKFEGKKSFSSFVEALKRQDINSAEQWAKAVEACGMDLADDFGIENRWHWDGFRKDILSMVIGECCSQVDVEDIQILRVAGPETPVGSIIEDKAQMIDVPRGKDVISELRLGPQVRYFNNTRELAQHVNGVHQQQMSLVK